MYHIYRLNLSVSILKRSSKLLTRWSKELKTKFSKDFPVSWQKKMDLFEGPLGQFQIIFPCILQDMINWKIVYCKNWRHWSPYARINNSLNSLLLCIFIDANLQVENHGGDWNFHLEGGFFMVTENRCATAAAWHENLLNNKLDKE